MDACCTHLQDPSSLASRCCPCGDLKVLLEGQNLRVTSNTREVVGPGDCATRTPSRGRNQ